MREHLELRVYRVLIESEFSLRRTSNTFHTNPHNIAGLEKELFESVEALSPAEFSVNYQVVSLLKKWRGWDVAGSEVQAASLNTWLASEKQCFATNYRLKALNKPELSLDSPFSGLIIKTREKILRLIGHGPSAGWAQRCDWPTGATFDSKMDSTVGEKVCKIVSCSARAYPYAQSALGDFAFKHTRSNRVEFVPKTFKVHRPIACEPTTNAFLQKGCGRELRAKLLDRCGIDLRTQASLNRDECFLAFSCGLSTIDLESASDTMSYQLVKCLLPERWFTILDDLRCEYSSYKEKHILLEKFSSMGNGFTFELETVIFRAICEACLDILGYSIDTLAVFGDDIVVDRRAYSLITRALSFFGFTVNPSKSFMDGSFFESCGKHFHREFDVTPCYQKEVVKNDLFQCIAFHNRLFRWGTRTGNQSLATRCCAIIKEHALTLNKVRRFGMPLQPPTLEGDFGFVTTSPKWGRFDKHGDYILNRALVRSSRVISLINHHEFYKDNWLRCGNSFYASREGHLEWTIGQHSFIKTRKRLWRGGEYSLTNYM